MEKVFLEVSEEIAQKKNKILRRIGVDMRIDLDKKYLQDITKGNHDLLISEEQQQEMERIKGMLLQDIRFCSLITGYRGTGKSSFIKYILNKFQDENENILVVSFNAAKYQNYSTFIRRFVRELFFQMDRKGVVSKQLRKMYYHTFFDIKETYLNNFHKFKIENAETENEEKEQIKGDVNILKLVGVLLKIAIYILSIIAIWNNSYNVFFKVICSTIWLAFVLLCEMGELKFGWEKIIVNKKHEKSEIGKEKEHKKLAEILYDNEIAEYYVYDELQRIDEQKNNLVFVLDELDKVDDNELDMIFHDLKPLFLSGNCNFILIAGRNMEKYLHVSKQDVDSIATTIFTHRIYIPLSTIQDMREFSLYFYKAKDEKLGKKEFYSNEDAQKYFNYKIFEAKGVKRAFVNGVLSDLRWENGEPYIDFLSKNISKDFMVLFDVLEKMEEVICQEYMGPKRDELLQNLYCWIEKIRQNQHTVFALDDIMGSEESLISNIVYTNVAEQMNLAHSLLESMVKDDILEETDNCYKWRLEIAVNKKNDDVEQSNRMLEYVEIFQKQWEEIGSILSCFAIYNGIVSASYEIVRNEPEVYGKLLEDMIPNLIRENSELQYSLSYLCKLYDNGIETNDMGDIQNHSRKISITKAILIEELSKYTFEKNKYSRLEEQQFYTAHYERERFDAVYNDSMSGKMIFIEIKYYKEYNKMISSSFIYKLLRGISYYTNINEVDNYMLKLIVFTDYAAEADMKKFKSKCDRMLEALHERNKLQIVLVPFNDYEVFKSQLDFVIR